MVITPERFTIQVGIFMAPEGPALCSQEKQENNGSPVGCCTPGCPDISILQTGIRHKGYPSGP